MLKCISNTKKYANVFKIRIWNTCSCISNTPPALAILLKKLDSLNYILQTVLVYLYVNAPKVTEFCRITQNNGDYATQGHSG